MKTIKMLALALVLIGADDIDGTVGHEEIMHSAGSTTPLDSDVHDLVKLIQDTNQLPVRRNSIYNKFEIIIPEKHEYNSLPVLT